MSFTFILSINAGSSSVKLSLYKINPKEESPTPKLVVDSSISKLTSPPPIFSYTNHDSTSSDDIKNQEVKEISSQDDAFKYFLDHLTKDSSIEGISSGDDIRFVCHRIVHGGDFSKPVIINDHTYNYMDQLTDLAPL